METVVFSHSLKWDHAWDICDVEVRRLRKFHIKLGFPLGTFRGCNSFGNQELLGGYITISPFDCGCWDFLKYWMIQNCILDPQFWMSTLHLKKEISENVLFRNFPPFVDFTCVLVSPLVIFFVLFVPLGVHSALFSLQQRCKEWCSHFIKDFISFPKQQKSCSQQLFKQCF